jgi:hypothetical protein
MINWNPPAVDDKALQLHAMSGAVTALGTHFLTEEWLFILLAVSVVMGAKELWAYFNPSKCRVSLSHAVATGIGGLAATAAIKFLL